LTLVPEFGNQFVVFKHDVAKRIIDVEQGRIRRWVANKINITPESLGKALHGRCRIGRDTALRLADLLSVPKETLWNDTESKAS
jgi:plasmid maintenance system antidote protein VapI